MGIGRWGRPRYPGRRRSSRSLMALRAVSISALSQVVPLLRRVSNAASTDRLPAPSVSIQASYNGSACFNRSKSGPFRPCGLWPRCSQNNACWNLTRSRHILFRSSRVVNSSIPSTTTATVCSGCATRTSSEPLITLTLVTFRSQMSSFRAVNI